MGLFDKFKKTEENEDKVKKIEAINLKKEEVHKICLTKKPLTNLVSRVAIAFDFSGSMNWLYHDGTVQKVVENFFPLALEFDDNATMEIWLFSDGFYRLPDMTLDNFYDYIKRETKKFNMGGTNYAPVMEDIVKKYTKEESTKLPTYVAFITDGDNFDKNETTDIIKEASKYPIFWQFIGIGSSRKDYLEKLDDMEGRYVDNADFFNVDRVKDITYEKLLDEYPQWISNPKVKSMLQ